MPTLRITVPKNFLDEAAAEVIPVLVTFVRPTALWNAGPVQEVLGEAGGDDAKARKIRPGAVGCPASHAHLTRGHHIVTPNLHIYMTGLEANKEP